MISAQFGVHSTGTLTGKLRFFEQAGVIHIPCGKRHHAVLATKWAANKQRRADVLLRTLLHRIGGLRPPRRRSAHDIIAEVSADTGFSLNDLRSACRNKRVCAARFRAAYEIAEQTEHSLPTIGHLLGDRDHSTIIHAIRTHRRRNNLPVVRGIE